MPVLQDATIITAHDRFYQPPAWEIRVKLNKGAVIRNAKIYKGGKGVIERHFASDATTLAEVLEWANRHDVLLRQGVTLEAEHLHLVV